MSGFRVESTRGELVESIHRVSAAVTDASGRLVASAGDPELVTFWRSAAKPFQAMPLVADGAADAFGLGAEELALPARSACQPWTPRKQEKASVRESLLILVLTGPPTMGATDVASVVVDNRNEIRQFLTSRRARITPEQAGLPVYGANRRVPGLRREEVALLAGVSVDYYTRLERGNLGGVSEAVLDALAQALQRVRPGVQRILDAITDAPADVRNGRRDIRLFAMKRGSVCY